MTSRPPAHPPLLLEELLQLLLLTGQLQLHVLTARHKTLIVLKWKKKNKENELDRDIQTDTYFIAIIPDNQKKQI